MSTSNWRNYGIWRLGCYLHYLETTDAQVYEIRDLSGKLVCGFYGDHQLRHYPKDQYQVIRLNKEKYMEEMRIRIKEMKDERGDHK